MPVGTPIVDRREQAAARRLLRENRAKGRTLKALRAQMRAERAELRRQQKAVRKFGGADKFRPDLGAQRLPAQPFRRLRWVRQPVRAALGLPSKASAGKPSPFMQGLADGKKEGLRQGRDEGYQQGYSEGYAAGVAAGRSA
jgi:flagellar biosynthesis/type III secretory pathway protein FliH